MAMIVAVFLGGGLGASARYGLSLAARRLVPEAALPWGTFAANIIGCAALGLLAVLFTESSLPREVKIGATTGLLGGLTTFSTFSHETLLLAQSGRWGLAATNLAGNLIVGLLAAAAGGWLGARFIGS